MKDLTTIANTEIHFNHAKTKEVLECELPKWRHPKYISVFNAIINSKRYEITACRALIRKAFELEHWDHVVVRPVSRSMPSYIDMAKIADIFFSENEYAMQVIPRRVNYVNIEPYTLHLWNLPTNNFLFDEIYQKLKSISFKPFYDGIALQFFVDANNNGALAIAFEKDWPSWDKIVNIKEQVLGINVDAVIINRCLREDLSNINGYKVIILWLSPYLKLPDKRLV